MTDQVEDDRCEKCQTVVRDNQNSICCDLCNIWYHLKCSSLTLAKFKSFFIETECIWYCKKCVISTFPFSSLNNNSLCKLYDYQSHLDRTIQKITNMQQFSTCCQVCTKKVVNRHKCIPCSSCKCLIHIKCSNKANSMLKTATQIMTWNCSSCIKAIFPFTELDDFELNRIHNPANDDLTNPNLITEKLRQRFNFNDVLNGENEISNTINCDYYYLDDFKILCDKHVSKNCLSVFHSNISSLQGNFDKLELLITQLNDSHFCFDIISLTETWTPKSKEYLVEPKNLIGYQKYMG